MLREDIQLIRRVLSGSPTEQARSESVETFERIISRLKEAEDALDHVILARGVWEEQRIYEKVERALTSLRVH